MGLQVVAESLTLLRLNAIQISGTHSLCIVEFDDTVQKLKSVEKYTGKGFEPPVVSRLKRQRIGINQEVLRVADIAKEVLRFCVGYWNRRLTVTHSDLDTMYRVLLEIRKALSSKALLYFSDEVTQRQDWIEAHLGNREVDRRILKWLAHYSFLSKRRYAVYKSVYDYRQDVWICHSKPNKFFINKGFCGLE